MIKFKDLSGWLKTACIVAWLELGIYTISFLYGFFLAI